MNKSRRIISLSTVLLLLIAILIPNQVLAVSESADEEYYNALISQSKQEFIDTVTAISSDETSPQLIAAAVAMSDRDDISNDDLVSIIVNPQNPYLLRQIAIESYSSRQPASIDVTVLEMMADTSENAALRTLAVSLLSDFLPPEDSSLLVNVASSSDENLSYNAIKALERVDSEAAVSIASEIYDNYENETPARINIASKVLSRSLSSNSSLMRSDNANQNNFIEKSLEIYNSTTDEEIRYAIGQSITRITNADVDVISVEPRATGYQGYAAYRDGVGGLLGEWHAAIIYASESEYILAHAAGTGETTELANYSDFLDGNDSMGYYRPSSTTLTSSKRDSVCSTASDLVSERIPYVLADPIRYSALSTATNKYPVSDITAIRCDGVVEYSYEYNNIRVFGSSDYWDITSVDSDAYNVHSGYKMTPKIQAEDYMTYMGIF